MSRLEKWYKYGDRVIGEVYDDVRCTDGTVAMTSSIVKLDREAKTLQTKNTLYELGEEFDVRNHEDESAK